MPDPARLDPRLGTEFLGYRIEALVGRGGMGVVYRAYDLRLKRNVALKLVVPDYAEDQGFRERFLTETELAASLEHPDVVPIYDAGEVEGQLYLAMRFVEGTDLKRILAVEAPLEPARALAIVGQVADALDAAHERGLVHRDVKPSNVLLDEREHAYLADFGLTRRLDDPGSPTGGLSVGTPAYVAPEQIRGDDVDGRADQYALACLLHECLTGEPPFRRASEVAMLYAHLEDTPLPLGGPLDPVLAKALAKAPEERYATCRELVHAARDALKPATVAEPRGIGRRIGVLAGLAGVLVSAVAIAVFAFNWSGSESIEAAAGNSVGFVDPESNRLIADVAVGTNPTDVAVGDGAVWVTNAADGTVDRIDLATRTVRQTIRVGDGPDGIAFGYDAVWVANGLGGTVSRIDPQSNEVTQTIPVGVGPSGIATGRGAVWVVNRDDSTLTKIHAGSGKPLLTAMAGAGLVDIAVAAGAVWVTSSGDGNVLRIDPRTGEVLDAIAVAGGPGAMAATSGALWVLSRLGDEVSRIDPATSTVTATVPVGAGASGIAVVHGAVWVASDEEGSVFRIDPATNLVTETISIGGRPSSVAANSAGVFIGVRPAATAHRGGTVTFLNQGWFEFSGDDPALSFSTLLTLTNDGLTAFRRVGGADSAELVPDLAVSLPEPTAGGKSYAFRLRKGIRYSTGAPVRPSDFKVAFERLFQREAGFDYQGIAGADGCTPKRCDLTKGIDADDGAGTVTFRLTRPDPYFLAKLAQPSAFPLPARTPRRILDTRPPPATGPYMIAAFVPGKQVRLVRNPRFREWSKAARPAGYPDEIVIRLDVSPAEQVRRVRRGEADVADLTNSGVANVSALRARYGGRLHSLAGSAVVYTFLNTRVAPFHDARARKALNYALDREAIVRSVGGPDVASASCQLLSANSPGYRPYCPYKRDLAKAKRLAAASGTLETAVVVWTRASLATYYAHVVAALRAVGYRAKLKVVEDDAYYPELFKAASKVQAGYIGFYAAYPSPGSFIEGVANTVADATGFRDKAVERVIQRARDLEKTDALASNELWARVDRMITDRAPLAPMYNLRNLVLVSARVRNFQYHPLGYTLLDQLWVR